MSHPVQGVPFNKTQKIHFCFVSCKKMRRGVTLQLSGNNTYGMYLIAVKFEG